MISRVKWKVFDLTVQNCGFMLKKMSLLLDTFSAGFLRHQYSFPESRWLWRYLSTTPSAWSSVVANEFLFQSSSHERLLFSEMTDTPKVIVQTALLLFLLIYLIGKSLKGKRLFGLFNHVCIFRKLIFWLIWCTIRVFLWWNAPINIAGMGYSAIIFVPILFYLFTDVYCVLF